MKFWLIKSSGRVIGPYSTQEVSQLIRERKVSIIDEIRDPTTRWKYIREHANFLDVVRSLREVKTTAVPTGKLNDEKTDTVTIATLKEATEATAPGISLPLANSNTNSLDNLLDKKKEQRVQAQTQIKTQQLNRRKVDPRKKKSVVPFLMFAVFALSALGGGGWWYLKMRKAKEPRLTTEQYLQIANRRYALGDFELAATNYDLAAQLGILSPEDQVHFGLAKVHTGNPLEGRQLLEGLLPSLSDASLAEQSKFAVVVSKLREGQTDLAIREFQAFSANPRWKDKAQFNIGSALFAQKRFSEADAQFQILKGNVAIRQPALLYQTLVALKMNPSELDPAGERINSLKATLRLAIEQSQDFRAETLLLLARIHLLQGQKKEAQELALQLLDQDPFISKDHIHEALLDTSGLSWKNLFPDCQMVINAVDAKVGRLLTAFCTSLQGDEVLALQKLQELRLADARDPALFGPYALLLLRQKKIDEARAVIKVSPYGSLKLPMVLRARLCEIDGDFACALENWKRLAEMDPNQLEAITGMANAYLHQKQFSSLKELLDRGRVLSPNYRPLREIATEMSNLK